MMGRLGRRLLRIPYPLERGVNDFDVDTSSIQQDFSYPAPALDVVEARGTRVPGFALESGYGKRHASIERASIRSIDPQKWVGNDLEMDFITSLLKTST